MRPWTCPPSCWVLPEPRHSADMFILVPGVPGAARCASCGPPRAGTGPGPGSQGGHCARHRSLASRHRLVHRLREAGLCPAMRRFLGSAPLDQGERKFAMVAGPATCAAHGRIQLRAGSPGQRSWNAASVPFLAGHQPARCCMGRCWAAGSLVGRSTRRTAHPSAIAAQEPGRSARGPGRPPWAACPGQWRGISRCRTSPPLP